jgi:ribosome-associated translation inhibitor RaiA
MMHITVCGFGTPITDAQRAYAEYRVFTSIAPHEKLVRVVDVAIRREPAAERTVVCAVVVDLGASGRIKTQARAAHPSAAIDRAADRAGWLVGRRIAENFTLKPAGFSS